MSHHYASPLDNYEVQSVVYCLGEQLVDLDGKTLLPKRMLQT